MKVTAVLAWGLFMLFTRILDAARFIRHETASNCAGHVRLLGAIQRSL